MSSAQRSQSPSLPTGTEVASYKTHEEATAGLEVLSKDGFPLPAVSVVGTDLHMVDRVLGKLTPGKVALGGAMQGVTWGLIMSLIFLVFSESFSPLVPLFAFAAGVTMGVLIAMFSWMGRKDKSDFSTRSQLVATRYAILVEEQTDRAYQLLRDSRGNLNRAPKRRVRREERLDVPSEYGSRPGEQPRFGVRLEEETKVETPQGETEEETLQVDKVDES